MSFPRRLTLWLGLLTLVFLLAAMTTDQPHPYYSGPGDTVRVLP